MAPTTETQAHRGSGNRPPVTNVEILNLLEKIMSGLTDLTSAVTAMVAEIQVAVTAIQNQNAAGGDPDAAVETQAQAILAATATLTAAVNAAQTAPAAKPAGT
jgi:hypothetical protein